MTCPCGDHGDACAAVGFPAERVEAQVRRQAVVERQPAARFLDLAEPTELAAAAAFAHTAVPAGRATASPWRRSAACSAA